MVGTTLAVASGKGGVGKTTTTVNLALALWDQGNVVGLIDADLGMPNLASLLGVEASVTLHDVLAGCASVAKAGVTAKDGGVVVIPGDPDLTAFADADPTKSTEVLENIARDCDYVFVDTGAGLSYETVYPLQIVDEVLLVTTPEPTAIEDTRKTRQLTDLQNGTTKGVIVTKSHADTDPEAIASEIGVELLGTIPEDPAVTKHNDAASPLVTSSSLSPASIAYRKVADSFR